MESLKAEFKLKAELMELDELVTKLVDFFEKAKLTNLVNSVNLVLEELFANSVNHGKASEVIIRLNLNDDALHIHYKDDGIAYNPFSTPKPNLKGPIEERSIGGLGIHLIKEMTIHQSYERNMNFNLISLTMNI